ncbi:MAG: 3'-5' exonuclease [Anaerolineae bacterium]|nr:3'-5' exonuclease [Anaerolineae bacterium]
MRHQLTLTGDGYRCEICRWTWKTPPVSRCPGLPRYSWNRWPGHLMTKTQLDRAGYSTGKTALPKPVGVVAFARSRDGWLRLYDVREAVPRRPLTAAQLESLARGRRALAEGSTCAKCGVRLEGYSTRPQLCERCTFENRLREAERGAILWAREMLAREFLVLDTETTDLGTRAEIVGLAVIDQAGDVIHDLLVKPTGAIPPDATAIHGITSGQVADSPTFPLLYKPLVDTLTGRDVVIYNAAFDVRVLAANCQRHNLPPIEANWHCAMEAYARFCGEWSEYHGSFKWQRLPGGDHTALGDCRATLALLRRMAATEIEENEQ